MLFDSSAVSQPATKLPREGLPQDAEVHCYSLNPHQHFLHPLCIFISYRRSLLSPSLLVVSIFVFHDSCFHLSDSLLW